MNLKAMNNVKKHDDSDVNIIPVMNIFLLLIPFLLLTAAFVKIAILEISLPSLNKSSRSINSEQQKKLTLVILVIKDSGFQLKVPGFKFDPVQKKQKEYDFTKLATQLKEVKVKHASAEDIIISPEGQIKYDIIIKAMDSCREKGFPNVSLAG